jgi:DNA-binding LacI/PurR family transcriptional regulator
MTARTATLKDVAREAGVSVMTVSMSLRDHPRISTATRERVRDIAVKLGYCPNPETQQLMEKVRAHRRGSYKPTIAVLDPQFERTDKDSYTRRILQGAEQRARQLGYQLEVFPIFDKQMSQQRLMTILNTRNITGVLIPPLPHGRAHLRLNWPQLVAVSTTGALWRPRLSSAIPDFFHNACLALREMRKLGYKRIGYYIPINSEERARHAFSAAYYLHCISEGIAKPPPVFRDYDDAKLKRWMASNKFDAILGNDYVEFDYLNRFGLLDHRGYAAMAWNPSRPDVAGVNVEPEKIGMTALDLVDAALRRNELGLPANPKTSAIEGRWMKAASTRPQHAKTKTG